jgi:hypothetical protein
MAALFVGRSFDDFRANENKTVAFARDSAFVRYSLLAASFDFV